MALFRKGKDNNTEYVYDVFWQPFVVTYVITIVVIVATCILQFNMSDFNYTVGSYELRFYRINCANYIELGLAKVAESLVPTTMTFSFTLLLAGHERYQKNQITNVAVLTAVLAIVGLIFPTMANRVGFYIILIIICILIACLLSMLRNVVPRQDKIGRKSKAENSDGKFSR